MQPGVDDLDICEGTENMPIYFDCDGQRSKLHIKEFQYVCCNIPGSGLEPINFEDLILGCDCSSSCSASEVATNQKCNLQVPSSDNQSSACTCLSKRGYVYNENGRLSALSRDSPNEVQLITECNSRCSCPHTCRNRVVQKGIIYHLEVFKHGQKGLCLRALELIKELTFICEYAGEVINYEEAKRRADEQTENDMNYIFALREHFSSGPIVTFIDPCKRGNIGRFINHSCTPNAFIVPIRVENLVPRLCVFALRDIGPGEEITYDYGSEITGHSEGEGKDNYETVSRNACHCMSQNCKGTLPFDSTLFQIK